MRPPKPYPRRWDRLRSPQVLAALVLILTIFREDAYNPGNTQGLATFVGYYPRFFGSMMLPNAIGDHFIAGLVYRGFVSGRNDDVLGAGFTWAELFRGGSNQETAGELFYKAQLTPKLSFQPDLQYISTPSGLYRDALVVGVRYQVEF